MNFVSVASPRVGENIQQRRKMRVSLIPGTSGEKWRGIEAMVGTWGIGVRQVPVLELRRIVLKECLHTLISNIKTEEWL